MQSPTFVNLETKFVAPQDGEPGVLTGYGSVYGNVDGAGDIIAPGAFAKSINDKRAGGKTVPFLWQHEWDKPIGAITQLSEDPRGLKITVKLDLNVQQAKEAYSLIRNDVLSGLSVGFQVVKADMDPSGGRTIREAKLWEVSVVTFPCNEAAIISSIKTADPVNYTQALHSLVAKAVEEGTDVVIPLAVAQNIISLQEADQGNTNVLDSGSGDSEGGASIAESSEHVEAEAGLSEDGHNIEPQQSVPEEDNDEELIELLKQTKHSMQMLSRKHR